jgi:hypothetical protein
VTNLNLLRKPPLKKNPLKKNPLKNLLQKRVKKNGEQREKADGVIGPRRTPLGVYPRGNRLQVLYRKQTTSKNNPYNK